VLSDAGSNAGLVAYEMAMLVKRVRRHLAAAPRSSEQGAPRPQHGTDPASGTF
jgi:hypothetical protein